MLGVGAVLGVAIACANATAPPGGAPDTDPPLVLSVTPGSMAINQKLKTVRLRFNEVVSETPKGVRSLSDLVFISPRSGDVKVSWGRDRIDIRPSKGWKANTVYSVQVKPGLVDLRGNSIDSSVSVVFSTGPNIPQTRIQGVVFDWGMGKGAGGAVVEAMAPDSTRYQVVADSAGRYDLQHIPVATYLLRAFIDKNSNKDLDPLEQWDSVRTLVSRFSAADFYTFQHDTVGIRIADITVQDSNRVLKISFDKPFVPTQLFDRTGVRVLASDSTPIPVVLVQTAREKFVLDSLRDKAKADSIDRVTRAREDSTPGLRARNDSIARVRRADSVAAADRAKREAERIAAREAARRGGRVRPPSRDTLPAPKMARPRVYSEVFITLDKPLPPQKQFRVQVLNVRSLSEVVKSPSRTFSTARADTTKRPPGAPGSAPGRPPVPPVRRDTMPALFFLPSRR